MSSCVFGRRGNLVSINRTFGGCPKNRTCHVVANIIAHPTVYQDDTEAYG